MNEFHKMIKRFDKAISKVKRDNAKQKPKKDNKEKK